MSNRKWFDWMFLLNIDLLIFKLQIMICVCHPSRQLRRLWTKAGNFSDLFIFNFHKVPSDWRDLSLRWFIPWLLVTCLPSRSFISSCCSASRKPTFSCTRATRTSRRRPTALTPALGWACFKQRLVIMMWVWCFSRRINFFHSEVNLIYWFRDFPLSRLSTRNWTTSRTQT